MKSRVKLVTTLPTSYSQTCSNTACGQPKLLNISIILVMPKLCVGIFAAPKAVHQHVCIHRGAEVSFTIATPSGKRSPSTQNRTPDLPMVAIRASRLNHLVTRDRRKVVHCADSVHKPPPQPPQPPPPPPPPPPQPRPLKRTEVPHF